MKRAIMLLALAFQTAFTASAATRIATRNWVNDRLAEIYSKVETAEVTEHADGSFTAKSAYVSASVTNAVSVSVDFRFGTASGTAAASGSAPVLLSLFVPRAYAEDTSFTDDGFFIWIDRGFWTDNFGDEHEFVFDDPAEFRLREDLFREVHPDVPSSAHACDVDPSTCMCAGAGLNAADLEEDEEYQAYRQLSTSEWDSRYSEAEMWIDASTWPADMKHVIGERTVYFFTDDAGNTHALNGLGRNFCDSGVWLAAIAKALVAANARRALCWSAYCSSRICGKTNPQHAFSVGSCGANSWSVCARNPAHNVGTAVHEYPGMSAGEPGHTCKCGLGDVLPHGELVPDGARVETADGWRQTMKCPDGCGFMKALVHTHHHTACGPCDAGDGCSDPCACGGSHEWGGKTDRNCAKCVCTTCGDCTAHPSDITMHTWWLPCGEDNEDDNDDGRAAGAHCQCQCKTFGHNANTEHDYQTPPGMSPYEDVNERRHYHVMGVCSRCAQRRSKLEEHEYGDEPSGHRWVSESSCRAFYTCSKDGCGHVRNGDPDPHSPGEAIAHVNVSQDICRARSQCTKCLSFLNDDTHGHERGADCMCARGCGYRFEHVFSANACGFRTCTVCGTADNSTASSHVVDVDMGTYHACRCGETTGLPHVYGPAVETGRSGNTAHMQETCTACGHVHQWDEDVGEEPEGGVVQCNGNRHFLNPGTSCQCFCGYYGPGGHCSSDEGMHAFANDGSCLCRCGRYHRQKEYSAQAISSGEVCSRICSKCARSGSGIDVQEAANDQHDAFTDADALKAGRCGCRCGRVSANDSTDARFHYQNKACLNGAPYCRCIGEKGSTTGGQFHFPNARGDCSDICATVVGGKKHLAAKSKELAAFKTAYKSDHTPYSGTSCRCACGDVTGSDPGCPSKFHLGDTSSCKCHCGTTLWKGVHIQGSSCYCKCDDRHHFTLQRSDGKCPDVCHGSCSDSQNRTKHTPDPSGCGCECGQFGGSSYGETAYHNGHGTPSCMCSCGRYHNRSESRSDCTLVCKLCGDGRSNLAFTTPVRAALEDEHTQDPDGCGCKCGKCSLPHVMPPDACRCHCGVETIPHNWNDGERENGGTFTCQTCGKVITVYTVTYICKRCGKTSTGTGEDGHDPNCGKDEGTPPAPNPRACTCGCVYGSDCFCDACRGQSGTCSTCNRSCSSGTTSGGTTSGGGVDGGANNDPDDIM